MRLLRSLSFRLALLYCLLLSASTILLGGIYYVVAIKAPLNEVELQLLEELAALEQIHAQGGMSALVPELERRAAAPSPRLAYHALLRPDGAAAAANLPSWPREAGQGWLRIDADVSREGDEDEYEALVIERALAGGGRLLIGRDIEDEEELEEGITDAALWLLPALLLFSAIGGLLMSRAIGRRIDSFSSAARNVIEGDLSQRIMLRGSGDDFDHLGATLNAMLDRIESAMDSIRRVSDSVAHELRTPLSRLHADLVQIQQAEGGGRLEIALAIGEAKKLSTMFDAVLRISRIEGRRYAAKTGPVDLSRLLGDAAEFHEPAAQARGQRLEMDVTDGLQVEGDADLIFQAVSNLLDNAIKFAPSGGRIGISAIPASGSVEIAIADDGPGVPARLHGRLTERFFRAPDAEGTPGFGLGLALVEAVARHHGSTIRFLDAVPGLRVLWTLPVRSRRAS